MKPLSTRILELLPQLDAPLAGEVSARLGADVPSVRKAFEKLEATGAAKIVRRGNGLHLVPADYPGLICAVCRAEFTRGKGSKRRACSRPCWISLGWRETADREGRVQAIRTAHQTPEARAKKTEVNHKRWADPKQRERLSEWNRKRWADPVTAMEISVASSRAHSTPERKAMQSAAIQARWDSEEGRAKLEAGMRGKAPSPKRSEEMRARWQDPELREKYLLATKANSEKARKARKARTAA